MNPSLSKSNSQQGFTLMETVIVLFIFTLASLLIAEIFINVQRAQRRTKDLQVVLTEARYLLDVLTREIRGKEINYTDYINSYKQVPVPVNAKNTPFKLIDESDKRKEFRVGTSQECTDVADGYSYSVPCLQLSTDGSVWHNITTTRLAIGKLDFYINPLTNPYPDDVTMDTADIQPKVTIVLNVYSANLKAAERVLFYLQTTTTARYYKR